MQLFRQHTEKSAPEGALSTLSMIKNRYGFMPNLASFVAESPVALEAVLALSHKFDETTLTKKEQQTVLLTVSTLNACDYCKAVHTGLAAQEGLSVDEIKELISMEPMSDSRLSALRDFVQALHLGRGFIEDEKVEKFLSAGYTKGQVFEVVMGYALKTFTNYCNHLAKARPNEEFLQMAPSA